MAVNKNFVVKNGLEVATDVILANASTKNVGIGSTIPALTLDVRGGIGATDLQVTGFSTLTQDLQVGASGSVFYVSNSTNMVGVGTSVPNPLYTLDVRSPVSTGQTALYVYGDMRVTGDINLDDITLDDATIDNLTVEDTLTVAGITTVSNTLNVTGAANVTGALNVSGGGNFNTTGIITAGNLNVSGSTTFGNITGTISNLVVGAGASIVGVTTAASFEQADGAKVATTGKAIAMSMVFGG